MKDAKEELRTRLLQHSSRVSEIFIGWNASDGGPRMDVSIKASDGSSVDEWNDWMILGNVGSHTTGADIITNIVKEVLGSRVRLTVRGVQHLRFLVS